MNRLQVLAVASLALLSGLAPQLCAQDFEALAKNVAQELAGRQYDKVEARFDATMASAMPLEKLQNCLGRDRRASGRAQDCEKREVGRDAGLSCGHTRLRF